jgi:hypothetical protein
VSLLLRFPLPLQHEESEPAACMLNAVADVCQNADTGELNLFYDVDVIVVAIVALRRALCRGSLLCWLQRV